MKSWEFHKKWNLNDLHVFDDSLWSTIKGWSQHIRGEQKLPKVHSAATLSEKLRSFLTQRRECNFFNNRNMSNHLERLLSHLDKSQPVKEAKHLVDKQLCIPEKKR